MRVFPYVRMLKWNAFRVAMPNIVLLPTAFCLRDYYYYYYYYDKDKDKDNDDDNDKHN